MKTNHEVDYAVDDRLTGVEIQFEKDRALRAKYGMLKSLLPQIGPLESGRHLRQGEGAWILDHEFHHASGDPCHRLLGQRPDPVIYQAESVPINIPVIVSEIPVFEPQSMHSYQVIQKIRKPVSGPVHNTCHGT